MRVGVLGLQGAFADHHVAVAAALARLGLVGESVDVRRPEALAAVDGLIIPGGESTTISKLLDRFELRDALLTRAREEDFPILGTCAGLVLLSSEGDEQVAKTDTHLLGLMDMATDRNAFGRQKESFEADLTLIGFEGTVPGVFIRAPAIRTTWGACEPLGSIDTPHGPRAVAARQGNRLAIAFHPELTGDTRVHEKFLNIVTEWRQGTCACGRQEF